MTPTALTTLAESELTPELIDRVMKLSPENRTKLGNLLFDSLHTPPDDGPADDPAAVKEAWRDEIARRIKDIEEGRVQPIPGDLVMSRVRQRLREKHGI